MDSHRRLDADLFYWAHQYCTLFQVIFLGVIGRISLSGVFVVALADI